MTLKGIMTADACYLCGSWASRESNDSLWKMYYNEWKMCRYYL